MKPCGLSGLQETSNGNVFSPTINPNQQSLYTEKIPQNTCIYENFPTRKCLLRQETKASEIKVCIIYPNSSTLELWKFSNLTFGGYLPCTTLVLSVKSSSSSLLCKFYLEHVGTVWLTERFLASSARDTEIKWVCNLHCVSLSYFFWHMDYQ